MTDGTSAFPWTEEELRTRVRGAVLDYWTARHGQGTREAAAVDTGTRGEVTGGQHLNSISALLREVIISSGIAEADVRFRSGVELPGYYRPQKKWDIVVLRDNRLCAAIEMKSQVGPSFGNNFNNRTEEAVGSSADLWLAFREGILGPHQPWLGYFFFLEDAPASTRPVGLARSSFKPDAIFENTSYADRYQILCRRMVLERNYTAASLLLASRASPGEFREPAADLSLFHFARSLFGHLIGCG